MPFTDLGLSDAVLNAISDSGYTEPTPIQEQAIPVVLMNRDVLGCAQTGTGKTASFTLPMIDILSAGRAKARMPRSLILEPTRELASQVADNFVKYGKYTKLSQALLIGGVAFEEQDQKLSRGVDVLIATPGRLLDHMERGKVLLHDCKLLVIDEADRMLDMGFIPDIERIVGSLPFNRQTLFFSATMPKEIRRLAEKFLSNPKEISVAPPATSAATVTQGIAYTVAREKREVLRALLRAENVRNAYIFCNRKRDVGVLHRSLTRHGFNAAALHGDLDQHTRTETLGRFKNDEIQILVCSDVAARGLDIPDVSHVFNFDVPIHAEDYVHRIGRTGRAGREGIAYTIATKDDKKYVDSIERLIGKPIPVLEVKGFEALDPTKTHPTKTHPTKTDIAEEDEGQKPGRGRGRGRRRDSDERREGRPESGRPESGRPERGRREEGRREEGRRQDVRRKQEARGGRSRRGDAEVGEAKNPEGVVGFGDHLPAFLTIDPFAKPAPKKAAAKKTTAKKTAGKKPAPKKAAPRKATPGISSPEKSADQASQSIADEPLVETPAIETTAIETTTVETTTVETTVTETPVAEAPAMERPVTEGPLTEDPVTENPVMENPAEESAATEEKPAKKAAIKKPAAKKASTRKPAEKKTAAKKAPANKTADKKTAEKKTTTRKPRTRKAAEAETAPAEAPDQSSPADSVTPEE
ncbi:MAG: DEAD/DEAH box helicase [Alphaproteobacteria bacterium]|nr:DEAD/DEAH box helicase [Alphaproteobacteria bacterium]